jgi:hypothetical protein
MPYPATAFRVMIASPSDVHDERRIAQEVIADWNAIHSEDESIVLLPLTWERDSTPIQGNRPQAIINAQVLEKADILIAIFWTRIGSPTGVAPSGTVEELREHVAAQKPALLYFSSAPVHPDTVEAEQIAALREFKEEAKTRGLYEPFDSPDDFRRKFTRHLAQLVVDNAVFAEARSDLRDTASLIEPIELTFSKEARMLLKEASEGNGRIMNLRFLGGASVQANERNFVEPGNRRSHAEWEGALYELSSLGYVKDLGHKGEVFEVTREGYKAADKIIKDWKWPIRRGQAEVAAI